MPAAGAAAVGGGACCRLPADGICADDNLAVPGPHYRELCGASYITANAYLADITTPENRAKAFGLMGAVFGLGFIIGPAIGGLLGEFGPRVPFFVAAGVSGLNLVYGYLALPETLPPEKRRRFSLARSNPLGAFNVFTKYQGMTALLAVMSIYLLAHAVYPAMLAGAVMFTQLFWIFHGSKRTVHDAQHGVLFDRCSNGCSAGDIPDAAAGESGLTLIMPHLMRASSFQTRNDARIKPTAVRLRKFC